MEFDELLVTTKVDALVRLVKEKGSIELTIAAKLLGVEPENVEEWGHTLEEAGIVKIDYHLTKAYLTWLPPTEEEVVKESEKLKKEKSDMVQEISLLQQQMSPKAKELEGLKTDFQEMYSKLAPKIEKLHSQLEAVSSPKSEGGKELEVGNEKILAMERQLVELSDALANMKDELSGTRQMLKDKTPVASKFEEVDGIKKDLSNLGDRLKSVDERIGLLQKSLPKEKMDRDSVQKSLEPLKKDFADFKRSNANMRENLLSIKEAFEVLGTLDKSVGEGPSISTRSRMSCSAYWHHSKMSKLKATVLRKKLNTNSVPSKVILIPWNL
jgi:DNA repair exonuclease SbcCD ATPase subunit